MGRQPPARAAVAGFAARANAQRNGESIHRQANGKQERCGQRCDHFHEVNSITRLAAATKDFTAQGAMNAKVFFAPCAASRFK
jgi:hypothetical protein